MQGDYAKSMDNSGTEDNYPRNSNFTRREFINNSVGAGVIPLLGQYSVPHNEDMVDSELLETVQLDDQLPPMMKDPFIIGIFGENFIDPGSDFGWNHIPYLEKLRTVSSLHLDAFSTGRLDYFMNGELRTRSKNASRFLFANDLQLPASGSVHPNIILDEKEAEKRLGPLMERSSWEFPNGEKVTNPTEILSETFSGAKHSIVYTFDENGIISPFSPGALEQLVKAAETKLEQGLSGFWVDHGPTFRFNGLDFSRWAVSAFQDHLASLPDAKLQKLGIDDPDTFDIKKYLKQNNLTPDTNKDQLEDAIFREYVLHHHIGIKDFYQEFRSEIKNRLPDKTSDEFVPLYGNQFLSDFPNNLAPALYLSEEFDILLNETFPTIKNPAELEYKTMQAMGNFSKPSFVKGTLNEVSDPSKSKRGKSAANRYPDFDPDKEYPGLHRFQLAEGYAMDTRVNVPLTGEGAYATNETITQWITGDGSVPEEMQEFIDFIWAHEQFLADVNPDNDVALIISIPTLIWQNHPQWAEGPFEVLDHISSFVGTAQLLRENQILYDVILFGHPDLWDNTKQLDRLEKYDSIIFPAVESISSKQRQTIDEYIESGGSVITSGDPPGRDAMYVEAEKTANTFDSESVSILPADPGANVENESGSGESLLAELRKSGINSIVPTAGSNLAVNRLQLQNSSTTVIHLLNYDYSPDTDAFREKTEVTVNIDPSRTSAGFARFYSPQMVQDIDVETGSDAIQITIPSINEWGFVVLAESKENILADATEKEAKTSVEDAKNVLSRAQKADPVDERKLIKAEVKVNEAEIGVQYDAFDKAKKAAREATNMAAKAKDGVEKPTIAIDQAHGQPASQDNWEEPFEWIESRFPEYNFTYLDSWDEGSLDHISGLIIPPALSFRGVSHSFSESEIDQIESYVKNGGSLVVLARGGIAEDINDLTNRFGYTINCKNVVYPESESNPGITVTKDEHPLTELVGEMYANLSTPIEDHPENATVLARIPKASSAWLHSKGSLRERDDGEKSASGLPIFAHSKHNNGDVIFLGTHNYLYSPEVPKNSGAVMHNIFSFITEGKTGSKATTTTGHENDSTRTESANVTKRHTTKTEASGFGLLPALSALGGAIYILKNYIIPDSNS